MELLDRNLYLRTKNSPSFLSLSGGKLTLEACWKCYHSLTCTSAPGVDGAGSPGSGPQVKLFSKLQTKENLQLL